MSKCADADAGSTQADADADAASPWLKPSPGVLSDGAIVLLPSNTVCLLYDPPSIHTVRVATAAQSVWNA